MTEYEPVRLILSAVIRALGGIQEPQESGILTFSYNHWYGCYNLDFWGKPLLDENGIDLIPLLIKALESLDYSVTDLLPIGTNLENTLRMEVQQRYESLTTPPKYYIHIDPLNPWERLKLLDTYFEEENNEI
jgi:hypothetical protein